MGVDLVDKGDMEALRTSVDTAEEVAMEAKVLDSDTTNSSSSHRLQI